MNDDNVMIHDACARAELVAKALRKRGLWARTKGDAVVHVYGWNGPCGYEIAPGIGYSVAATEIQYEQADVIMELAGDT